MLFQVIRNEGITALWKGFTPCYMRIGPHTVITFLILEQVKYSISYTVFGVFFSDERSLLQTRTGSGTEEWIVEESREELVVD